MAITAIGPTGTVDQAGMSILMNLGDGMVSSLPGSSNLRVDRVTGQDRRVTVQAGYGRVPGVRYYSNAITTVDLPANGAGNPRLDWIVSQTMWNANPATTVITYVLGTAAATPVRPTLVQTQGVRWDLPLAVVRVDAGVGALPADAVFEARYWDMDGIAAQAAAADIDPPHRAGREMFVVATRELFISNGSSWSPVNVSTTSAPITAPGGWEAFGGDALAPTATYATNGEVRLSGRMRRSNPSFVLDGDGAQVGTVPTGYRPTATVTFPVATRVGWARLDVQANGAVILRRDVDAVTFPQATGYVSFDGVTYSTV